MVAVLVVNALHIISLVVTVFETTRFAKGWTKPPPEAAHSRLDPVEVRTCPVDPMLDVESTIAPGIKFPATDRFPWNALSVAMSIPPDV